MGKTDIIYRNNQEINTLISYIVDLLKRNNVKTFSENGLLNEDVKEILNMELRKCIQIYCVEYGFEFPNPDVGIYERRNKSGEIDTNSENSRVEELLGNKVNSKRNFW